MTETEPPASFKQTNGDVCCSKCGGRKFTGEYWGPYSEDEYFVCSSDFVLIRDHNLEGGFMDSFGMAVQKAKSQLSNFPDLEDLGNSLACARELPAKVDLKCSSCQAPFMLNETLVKEFVSKDRREEEDMAREIMLDEDLTKPYLQWGDGDPVEFISTFRHVLPNLSVDLFSFLSPDLRPWHRRWWNVRPYTFNHYRQWIIDGGETASTPIRLDYQCQICHGDIYVEAKSVVRVAETGNEKGDLLVEFAGNDKPYVETEWTGSNSYWSEANASDHEYSREQITIGCCGDWCWKIGNLKSDISELIATLNEFGVSANC